MAKQKFLNEIGVQHIIDWMKNTFSVTNHDHSPADIGLDKVENKSSSEIRDEIIEDNIVQALGYKPSSTVIRTWSVNELEG